MVRTSTTSRARTRLAVTAATGLVLGALAVGHEHAAAADTSTAYGVAATGVDPLGAQPSVSSDAEQKTASAGSVRSKAGTVTATGLSVKAGAGTAEASVASVIVGGTAIGAVSARCNQGKASAGRSGTSKPAANMTVVYGTVSGGKAVGATITILGAGGKAAETITVASVSCGTGTPPGPSQPPTSPPTQPPGGGSTNQPQPAPPTNTKSSAPTTHATKPAPKPTAKSAHRPVAVTG